MAKCTLWFLDTTAMFHCTFDRNLLHNLQAHVTPYHVSVEEDRWVVVPITWRGSVQTERLKLHDVHCIPDLQVNLISMYMLGKCGYEVHIGMGFCYVKHAKTGEVVGQDHNRETNVIVIEDLIIDQVGRHATFRNLYSVLMLYISSTYNIVGGSST